MPPATATSSASPEERLTSYVGSDLRDTCHVRSDIESYDEILSIACGEDDLPFDLSLFSSLSDMNDAYRTDVRGAETPPEPTGTCDQGNFEDEYERDGERVGRVNCREHTSSSSGGQYHVIEWTHE